MMLSYPLTAFAFNPILITASDLTPGNVATITCDGYTYSRHVIDGKVTFDVQAIAQTLFDKKQFNGVLTQDTTLLKRFEFEVTCGDVTQSASFDVIWGALQIGEVYSQSKTLTWYKNLPFTVPLYLSQGKTVKSKADNSDYINYLTLTAGKYNLPVAIDADEKVCLMVGGDSQSDSTGIFDYTFDYTFRPLERDLILIKLNADTQTEGVYLRWINKYGEYCYFLFDKGTESSEVRNDGITVQEFVISAGFTEGYNPGTDHPQSKAVQRSVRLQASLVDEDTFQHLESLTQSPVVDMFAGYTEDGTEQWTGVNISAGTFSRDDSTLKDFECTLLLPKSFTQSI